MARTIVKSIGGQHKSTTATRQQFQCTNNTKHNKSNTTNNNNNSLPHLRGADLLGDLTLLFDDRDLRGHGKQKATHKKSGDSPEPWPKSGGGSFGVNGVSMTKKALACMHFLTFQDHLVVNISLMDVVCERKKHCCGGNCGRFSTLRSDNNCPLYIYILYYDESELCRAAV